MIELKVTGMSCQHCVQTTQDALGKVPGVTRVQRVDLDTGLAVVEGDADPSALIAAVKEAGYDAEVV